ncbi:MAG: DUF3000 domain-containing protein [Actinobacteria bacterium]|nr:DUF3000 domain-containing protein [Actinomycetota bacterium]
MSNPSVPSALWDTVLSTLTTVRHRPDISVIEVPAPQRLAPQSVALTAELLSDASDSSGRFVVLHDPDPPEVWEGELRIVCFVKATLEPDIAADPMLTEVGWSWLLESLAHRRADYVALSGTVTRTTSEAFGGLSERDQDGTVEIRASWTPLSPDLGAHALAWTDLVAVASGLQAIPADVTPLGVTRRL